MKIDEATVRHVASLSRIRLNETQTARMADALAKILPYAEKLNEVDTSGVAPLSYVSPLANVTRPDEVAPAFDRAALLRCAPDCTDEAFVVPKVVE